MKKLFVTGLLSLGVVCGFAQGTIIFHNTSSTLISIFGDGLIQPPAGSYYFALLIAPSGTTDPTAFTFGSLYATNTSTAGMLNGGNGPSVWAPGETRAIEVAGWDASLGHDFNSAWLNNWPNQPGFGVSMIAEATPDPFTQSITIFGPNTISQGFYILAVPEPGAMALVIVGGILLLLMRCER